jgi:hypothetical protein
MILDTIAALYIPLIVLLTSLPVMWRKEHLWNYTVLQIVHLSNLVYNRGHVKTQATIALSEPLLQLYRLVISNSLFLKNTYIKTQ